MVGKVNGKTIEAVGDRRARRAASSVVRPEHVVIDEKLRTSSKEVCQRGFPVLGLESVLLVDPDPGQLPPLPRQVVTAASVLLLRLEQLESRCQPFFTPSRLLLCHRSFLSYRCLLRSSSTKACSRPIAASHSAEISS